MSGRNGLTWVTALTIASLLLGSGALNALAEGHGGGDHGGASGRGNAGHQQQTTAVANHDGDKNNHGNGAENKRNDAHADKQRDDVNKDVERHADNDDNDDLVNQPARVTDDVRPGLGCGDPNHEHERHDECRKRGDHEDNDDDDATVTLAADVDDSAGD